MDPSLVITFKVFNAQNIIFKQISTGSIITTFSRNDLIHGTIKVVHDGTISPPSYDIAAYDGYDTSLTSSAIISFIVLPSISVYKISVPFDGISVINPSMINGTVGINLTLSFSIINISYANLFLLSDPNQQIYMFTLDQILSQEVILQHDGSENVPNFQIEGTDGNDTTTNLTIQVYLIINATFLQNVIKINQGESVMITNEMIDASIPMIPNVIFIVSLIRYCHFVSKQNGDTTTINQFSKNQILDKMIYLIYSPVLGTILYVLRLITQSIVVPNSADRSSAVQKVLSITKAGCINLYT